MPYFSPEEVDAAYTLLKLKNCSDHNYAKSQEKKNTLRRTARIEAMQRKKNASRHC